jgi:magnesium-protoporphyrin O-methyltransferase
MSAVLAQGPHPGPLPQGEGDGRAPPLPLPAGEGLTYRGRRDRLEEYFDRTAVAAWARLTSDAPLGRIRASVRAGRDAMRATLLSWLPDDLTGRTVLDAGCGTGALAVEAARRGAHVIAIDLSPTLVRLAAERAAGTAGPGTIDFRVGDMLDPALGRFDHVVAMDSVIHYELDDTLRVIAGLGAMARASVVFTYAPWTPMLAVMHATGRLFPRADRAPAIVPHRPARMEHRLDRELGGPRRGRASRVSGGFYISQAQELIAR